MDRFNPTELLTELVAIPSVNRLGKTQIPAPSIRMVDHLEQWFKKHGVDCVRQPVSAGEQNLVATIPGRQDGPAIVFDAHTDTVPVDGWADRAFSPRLENNRLYGRSACDTKASLAAMACAFVALIKIPQSDRPNTIVLLASADEEYARTGVRVFLDSIAPNPDRKGAGLIGKIDAAVVGEPTCCQPVTACKGAARWDIVTPGQNAHSSTPHKGVNAITRMAHVIQLLEEYDQTILKRKTHPLVDAATLSATVIHGGSATNVIPDTCRLSVDLRTMPNENPADAMRDVQLFLEDGLDFPVQHESPQLWDGADVSLDHPFLRHCVAACASTLKQYAAIDAQPRGVNYGCHASDYSSRNIPAIVIGPGDIAVAHMVDEYVELDSLHIAAQIYRDIMTMPISV